VPPYDWVNGVDYPHKDQRGTVTGQIVLDDPLAPTPSTKLPHLIVGLAHPDDRGVQWIHNAKYYQFWNDGSDDGKFTITQVRPGNYTLHAFADGNSSLGLLPQSTTIAAVSILRITKLGCLLGA